MATDDPLHQRLAAAVDRVLEHGWQPADLVHFFRTTLSVRQSRLARAHLARHAVQYRAGTLAPPEWRDQLVRLGIVHAPSGGVMGGVGDVTRRWCELERLQPAAARREIGEVLVVLSMAPAVPVLLPPPSGWPTAGPPPVGSRADAHIPGTLLHRVRALLAKADRTEFEAEAEAFTAKAHELMARYRLDHAMLTADPSAVDGASGSDGARAVRVHVHPPYAHEKAEMLLALARLNGARAVWTGSLGWCTLFGAPLDLRIVDELYTSLLVQATQGMGRATSRSAHTRSAAFRRSFLTAFTDRVEERLDDAGRAASEAAEQHYGSALAPVLVARRAAIDRLTTSVFPSLRPMRRRRLDAEGWWAGRAAADLADIGAGARLRPAVSDEPTPP